MPGLQEAFDRIGAALEHHLEFTLGIDEISGSRANQHVNGEARALFHPLEQAKARRHAPFGEGAAELEAVRPRPFRGGGSRDALDTDLEDEFGHPLGDVGQRLPQ